MSNLCDSMMINVIVYEDGRIVLDNGKDIGMLNQDCSKTYREIYAYMCQKSIDMTYDRMLRSFQEAHQSGLTHTKYIANDKEVTARLKEKLSKHFGLDGKKGTIIVDEPEPLMSDEEITDKLKENLDVYCIRNIYKQCGLDDSTTDFRDDPNREGPDSYFGRGESK